MASVQPYVSAVGRGNGIAETTVAYIFTLIPLAVTLFTPICGFIVDRTQNATAVLLTLQTIALALYAVVFSSQYIRTEEMVLRGMLSCSGGKVTLLKASSSCIEQSLNCNLSCRRSMPDAASFKIDAEFELDNATSEICKTLWNQTVGDREGSCDFTCPCRERSPSSLAFYLYSVSVVLASLASGAAYTTSDAAICELLGDRAKSYGRQRLWGTLGYGACSPLLGFFIDAANRWTEGRSGYTPCLTLFAAFTLLDMLLLCCIPRLTMTKAPATFWKDVGLVFGRLHVAVFALWASLLGALYTVTSSYSTWLLEDIAAPKLIVGLYRAVGTFVELPMFFLSEPLLQQIGYFPVCSLAFALHAVGQVGLSFVRNPWYTLLTAIPSGAAFSLAVFSITVFAKEAAPLGTTASVMCILSVLGIEGVGAALGNLLGGTGFGKYGGRAVFRYAGVVAFACTILCTLSRIIMQRKASLIVSRRSSE